MCVTHPVTPTGFGLGQHLPVVLVNH